MKNKCLIGGFLTVLFVGQNAWANCDAGEMVLKFSHVTNATKHPKGIAANLFAQRVNQEMNGKVCMQVYPNSTLYNDSKALEALLNGDVHFAAPSLSKFEKFTKKFRIFDLPFLFTDIKAVQRFQKSKQGQKLLDSMSKKGLKGLTYWHNGMKQLSANKPLIKPTDAKGLKFRVQSSDVLIAQFRQLQASPQKMAFKEVYGALQTGVIDGQENTWSNIYGKKFFEAQDGITQTNHGILDYLVVTSEKWWQNLPYKIRRQLSTILQEVTAFRNAESDLVNQQNRDRIIMAGSKIRLLNTQQRQAWVDALKPVWKKFEKDVGKRALKAALKANN